MGDQVHQHNISVASRDACAKAIGAKEETSAQNVDNDDMTQWPTLQDWQVVHVRAIVSIRTLTLSNPCGKRVALQSYPPSTLSKFSILCQHNLVDEALTLYYSAYVKHVALYFHSRFHYHSIANICTYACAI